MVEDYLQYRSNFCCIRQRHDGTQIADFLRVLDPQSTDNFQTFNEICANTALLMHNDYLTGNSLEIFQQRDSRELAQRALVIGNKLGNKLDNYIHYLEYMWQDNSQIMDYLAQVVILASSSASIERVFSFFYRQTSYFLRRAISSATLSSMAYIYIEEIIEEMHLWDGKNYIHSINYFMMKWIWKRTLSKMMMMKKKVTGYTMMSVWMSETQLLVQQNIHLLLLDFFLYFIILLIRISIVVPLKRHPYAFSFSKNSSAEVCSKPSVFSTDFTSNGAPYRLVDSDRLLLYPPRFETDLFMVNLRSSEQLRKRKRRHIESQVAMRNSSMVRDHSLKLYLALGQFLLVVFPRRDSASPRKSLRSCSGEWRASDLKIHTVSMVSQFVYVF
ncbi:Hypothetical_protein [Hexamita inflata]|uniref:Hypothetical_protein n=1 Tax=Hexamita inflata TaxID=28002 RepID=A0AA86PHD2_9EUKA|nr:Hypothetical protein HINF_LOCUS26051 [Hexamita inflata]